MATTTDSAPPIAKKEEKGKVVKPNLKRKLEVSDIVGPTGVPKVLNDLSSVKFSATDNKKNLRLLLNSYAAWGRTVGKNYEFEEFVIRLEKLSGVNKVRQMLDAMRRGEEFVDLPVSVNNENTNDNNEDDINNNIPTTDNNNDQDDENRYQVFTSNNNINFNDDQFDIDDFDAVMNTVNKPPAPVDPMAEKLKEMERKRQEALERRRQGGGGSTWRAATVLARVDEEAKKDENNNNNNEDDSAAASSDPADKEEEEKKDEGDDVADVTD